MIDSAANPAPVLARRNVFIPGKAGDGRKSLRLELALLALPALSAAIVFAIARVPAAPAGESGKVTLRATPAALLPGPDLARERELRDRQMRFALSKVAPLLPEAALTAPVPPAVQMAKAQTGAPEPRTVTHKPMRTKRSAVERSARTRPAHHTVAAIAPPPPIRQSVRELETPVAQNWLQEALKWPVNSAAATLAPVKDTVVRTVDKAGDALGAIKRKIL